MKRYLPAEIRLCSIYNVVIFLTQSTVYKYKIFTAIGVVNSLTQWHSQFQSTEKESQLPQTVPLCVCLKLKRSSINRLAVIQPLSGLTLFHLSSSRSSISSPCSSSIKSRTGERGEPSLLVDSPTTIFSRNSQSEHGCLDSRRWLNPLPFQRDNLVPALSFDPRWTNATRDISSRFQPGRSGISLSWK